MSSFHIGCWNIQGLYSSTFGMKTGNPEFLKSIEDTDIMILTETWYQKDAFIHCPSVYHEVMVPSVKTTDIHKGRTSRRVLVWFKELYSHITPIKQWKSHTWLKLD